MKKKEKVKKNLGDQYYGNVKLNVIDGHHNRGAKRFRLNDTNQNIWIPNCYLEEDYTIKSWANLDFIFNKRDTKHKIDISLGKAVSKNATIKLNKKNSNSEIN